MNAVMGTGYSMSSPASVLLPTMQAINRIFGRLVQVAPARVSGDMTTLAGWWDQVVGDFQYGSTLGQVKAYLDAHPPALTDEVDAATQRIDSYLSTTCHINVSS
jgi:hypothetical protein